MILYKALGLIGRLLKVCLASVFQDFVGLLQDFSEQWMCWLTVILMQIPYIFKLLF